MLLFREITATFAVAQFIEVFDVKHSGYQYFGNLWLLFHTFEKAVAKRKIIVSTKKNLYVFVHVKLACAVVRTY